MESTLDSGNIIAINISTLALVAFVIVSASQIYWLRRRHRFDIAPFLRLNIETSTTSIPSTEPPIHEQIIEIDELTEWATAQPKSPDRYITIYVENMQHHVGGAAIAISFRAVLRFPKYKMPDVILELDRHLKGQIWLEPKEIFRIAIFNLKGLPKAKIDIDKIEYDDIDGEEYNRSYGYFHWFLGDTGQESWLFQAFPKSFPKHVMGDKVKTLKGIKKKSNNEEGKKTHVVKLGDKDVIIIKKGTPSPPSSAINKADNGIMKPMLTTRASFFTQDRLYRDFEFDRSILLRT